MITTRRAFDPHTIKLVIFDLDGTLIDSRLDLVHSVNAALRHIGRSALPDDVIASYVGDGAPILIQRALGGELVDDALVRKGLEFFLSYYREHKLDHTTVYAGVEEALTALQRTSNGTPRKMAVLSNKPVVPSRAIVEALGLGRFFGRFMAEIVLRRRSPTRKEHASCWKRATYVPKKRSSLATLTSM